MAERRCGQQFDTNIVGDHVSEVQAQLCVTVKCRSAAGNLAKYSVVDVTAAFLRINGDCTGTHDDVASLVCLRQWGGNCQGQQ